MSKGKVTSSVHVTDKRTKEIVMQKDESRAIIVEEMQDGEARVTVGGELSVSKEVVNGHWMGAKAFCTVSINCPQTEAAMLTAMNIAEELAFEKVYELTAAAEATISDEQKKALAGYGGR